MNLIKKDTQTQLNIIKRYNLDVLIKDSNKRTKAHRLIASGLNLASVCRVLKINYYELKSWLVFVSYLEKHTITPMGEKGEIEGQNTILIFLYQKYVEDPEYYQKYIDLVYDIRSWQAESTLHKIEHIKESRDWKAFQWLIDYQEKDFKDEEEKQEENNQSKIQVNIVSANTPAQVNRLEVLEAEVKDEKQ